MGDLNCGVPHPEKLTAMEKRINAERKKCILYFPCVLIILTLLAGKALIL